MSSNAIRIEEIDLTLQTNEVISISNAQHFLDEIIKRNKIPFNEDSYYFSDDIWDFSASKKTNLQDSRFKFNFNKCCDTFRIELKKYVLFKLLERNIKVTTIKGYFNSIYKFFNNVEKKGYFSIADLDALVLRDYFNDMNNISYRTYAHYKWAIKDFYVYYSANFKNILTKEVLELLDDVDYKIINAEGKNNKTPNIPQDYYNNFLLTTINIIDDDSVPDTIRTIAAFMLILSQTGLRISECLALEVDKLETISIFNGETAYYLNFKTWKRVRGKNISHSERTYVNELTKKGYDFLTKHCEEKRNAFNTTYLFLGGETAEKFPIDRRKFDSLKMLYFIYLNKYFPTINQPEGTYENINNIKPEKNKAYKGIETIAIPTNHQFRVHVCTELYKKGVPLQYIEKFMSHLSCEMADYYVRPTPQNPQENMSFSLDALQKIVTGETKLLGGNGGLQQKINEFIEKNHYNVETDLEAICEKLAQNIPIRQKTGGVCIKSSMLRECSKDSKTNEFYCAYGVCPNIFHFYYMADVSYRQAKELAETIEINRSRGLIRQVQKETNMLHNVVKNKLIPELDELKNVINKKGVQAVLVEYPDLKDIVENLDEIYKETELWLQK